MSTRVRCSTVLVFSPKKGTKFFNCLHPDVTKELLLIQIHFHKAHFNTLYCPLRVCLTLPYHTVLKPKTNIHFCSVMLSCLQNDSDLKEFVGFGRLSCTTCYFLGLFLFSDNVSLVCTSQNLLKTHLKLSSVERTCKVSSGVRF